MKGLPLSVGGKSKLISDKSKVSTNWHFLAPVLTGAAARGWGHGLRKLWSKVGTSEAVMRVSLEMHDEKFQSETADVVGGDESPQRPPLSD